MHIRKNFKKWTENLPQRRKRRTNGAHGDCLNVSPTAEANAPGPSELSATANSVKPSGPAGNLDKLSKPDSVNCHANTVSGLPEFPQAEKTIPDPPSSPPQAEETIPDPSSSHTTPTSSSDSNDPWELAYGILQAREPKLVEAYQAHLGLAQHDNSMHANLSNPRSVESVMTKLLEDREKKQWRFSLLGKDVKIREQTEKLAKFLLWADPVVKSAVSTQPYAALAWAGVSLLLSLLSSSTTSNLAMLKGFDSIHSIQIYWGIFEKKYLQSKHREEYQDLLEPLAALYSHIIEYQARAICHLSKAQLSRAWVNIAGESDWDEMISKIESSSEACSSHLSHYVLEETRNNRDSQLQEIRESRSILEEICNVLKADTSRNKKDYEDQNERNLLQALASDYEDDKNYNPLRVPDTCEWFFQGNEFRNWRDSDCSTLLWVSAGPGCGKSVLSRTLIDENRLSTNVTTSTICYFFFKDGDERRMSATNALCAFLHQLFTHDPTGTLIQNAVISHKNHGANLANNFSELWRLFIQCVSSPELGEVICLLDALDECNVNSMRQLLSNLKELYSKPQLSSSTSKLKFLITSRPYDDLELSFDGFPDTSAYLHFDGDDKSAEISHDIDLVIDAKLQKVARNFRESDRQMISKQIKDMKNRTYLWLHLTFDIIEQSPSAYSRRSDVKELLSGLPSKVSDAYEKILDRSENELQTKTLLEIVLAASRPLSLDEANIALTIALNKDGFDSYDSLEADLWPQDDFKSVVKNLCGLFINVYDSKLFFIHLTAREFLTDPDQSGKWKGRLSMTQSHKRMALACLSYLSHLGGQGSAMKISARFPLAQYSALHWMDHSRPTETENDVLDSILRFFLQQSQAFADWWKLFNACQPWVRIGHCEMGTPLYYASLLNLQRTAQVLLDKGADSNEQGEHGSALQLASAKGHEAIVNLLLPSGADIHAQGKYGNALQLASAEGHEAIVQLLLANGADVNAQSQADHMTALQLASAEGHEGIVQLLLANGADVNAQDQDNHITALQGASAKGHEGIVQLLLANGADVNAQSQADHITALQLASAEGHEGIVQLLLANGADVNAQGQDNHITALQGASAKGHEGIVQLLLANGADVNAQGKRGNALQRASDRGHEAIVKLLLASGADIHAQGRHGTALQLASDRGHEAIVKLLLASGADIREYAQGKHGNALQRASARGHEAIVKLLLASGADVNAQSQADHITALQGASAKGHEGIVQLLLANGADVNAQGKRGNALQRASDRGHEAIVKLLLASGADIHAQGRHGTALQLASDRGHEAIVKLLLASGADIREYAQGKRGNALQRASDRGHEAIVKLLLASGADIHAQGRHGTALQLASDRGHEAIVKLLLASGADIREYAQGKHGNALQLASAKGHEAIVKLLLANGADVNAQGKHRNALQRASARGHEAIVKLLLASGADIREYAQGKHGNALQRASDRGHEAIVQLLLANSADANARAREEPRPTCPPPSFS